MRSAFALILVVGCGGAPPTPTPQHCPIEVVVDAPPPLQAPSERKGPELPVSPPPLCGERLLSGACRWADGRCYSYYGWDEEGIRARTCEGGDWSAQPCQEGANCLHRINHDDSCTVVCDFPD